jgi:hypothetical protein
VATSALVARHEAIRDKLCQGTAKRKVLDSAPRPPHHQGFPGEPFLAAPHATGLESEGVLPVGIETAKEVESEPANMKVLTLCRMSSLDIRCSGGRSVVALNLTIGSQKKRPLRTGRKQKHTGERQQVPTFVRFPTALVLLDSLLCFLDELHRYAIDGLFSLLLRTTCVASSGYCWVSDVQLRPGTILTKKRSYIGKYAMIASVIKPRNWESATSNIFLYALNSSLCSF